MRCSVPTVAGGEALAVRNDVEGKESDVAKKGLRDRDNLCLTAAPLQVSA